MYVKICLLAALLFINTVWLHAQDAGEIMTQAMQLYQAGNYTDMAKLIEDNRQHLENSGMYTSFLYFLGIAYTNMGDYPKAETTCLEEKAIHERTVGKEHQTYLNTLTMLGYIYRALGDDDKAKSCYLEVITIREKLSGKDAGYAAAVSYLANLYQDTGEYDKATACYSEAKTIQEKVLGKEDISYATTLNNLAATYCATGEFTKAATCYRDAIAILAVALSKEHPNYAFSLGNLGTVYRYSGNFVKAEAFYLDAKGIQERVVGKQHPAYAITLNNLGGLYKDMGENTKAESCYQEEKNIWEKSFGREHPNHIRSLNDLGTLYLTTKNYARAEAVKTEADQMLAAQIVKDFTILSERQRSLFWDRNRQYFEQTCSYAYLHPANSMMMLAYNNTLFTKGLLLRTANGIRDAVYSSGDRILMKQYEELRTVRQSINALQAKESPNLQNIVALEHRADSLDKILTIASGAYRDVKKDMSMNWQDVRDALQTGEAAVEFVYFRLYGAKGFTDSVFYCALLLRKDVDAPVWIPLCYEKQLQTLTKREKGISDDDFTQQLYSGEKGEKLYRFIWQPLEKELQDVRTVYYSPSGILHQIAFAAIPAGELLSDRYNLHLVSGTREIPRLQKNGTGALPEGTAAVYGGLYYDVSKEKMIAEVNLQSRFFNSSNPAPPATIPAQGEETAIAAVLPESLQRGSSWMFLEGTETEAEQICDYLEEYKIPNRLYSGASGNEESFRLLSGTATGVIHLATHGFFLADIENDDEHRDIVRRIGGGSRKAFDNPLLRSGLLMAGGNRGWAGEDFIEGIEDGVLTADEITQMNLIRTQLVVLSACETGLGEVKNDEGVFGLQRAFKLAGVETLVMSLWTVPDDATAELMTAFYRIWLSGKNIREAFDAAQKQVRKKYKEPFYWAGFVMLD